MLEIIQSEMLAEHFGKRQVSAQVVMQLTFIGSCSLLKRDRLPLTPSFDKTKYNSLTVCLRHWLTITSMVLYTREAQGSHIEVYTDGSKMNERVGAHNGFDHYAQVVSIVIFLPQRCWSQFVKYTSVPSF